MERRIIFLCLLSFLMFAEALSWWTAGGLGPCLVKPEHSQQAANNNEHEDCPTFFAGSLLSFERGFDWIKRDDNDKAVVAGFTIVLAISTIGLWIATNKLWEAGERQLKHLSDTAAMELRAYISVENGQNTLQFKATHFEFRPVVVNNGSTPAGNVRVASNLGLVPPIIPPNFDYAVPKPMDESVATLAAHREKFHQVVFHRKATRAELRLIKKSQLIFHLYGTVFYTDVFNVERRTNFSFRIVVFGKRAAPFWGSTDRNNNTT